MSIRALRPFGLAAVFLSIILPPLFCHSAFAAESVRRPHILWITAEDIAPNLGCYGDAYARTPQLDAFARDSVRYTRAFATAPVCSPARSCLITGMYATSLGTQRLRSQFPVPRHVRGFAALLREAGYYTVNNVKTDYNLQDEQSFIRDCWDDCSPRAHWRGRKPGQPFFAVFNLMTTHQSRASVWSAEQFEKDVGARLAPGERHDPAKAPLPPYYPDTAELEKMRRALRDGLLTTRDAGFLTEPQVWERIGPGGTPLELAHDDVKYPLALLLSAAELAGRSDAVPQQTRLLRDADDGIRYWAAVGLHAAGSAAEPARAALREAMRDASPVVRIESAAALVEWGETTEPLRVLEKELRSTQSDVALHAARALELLGERARPAWPVMRDVLELVRREETAAGDGAMFLRFSLESALPP